MNSMKTMQCILDELTRMEARLTSALAGGCGEQSARACIPSDDDRSTSDYFEPTSEPVDDFTFVCAHTDMGEPVGVAGLGFGHGPLSLPDHLSPQISGELQPDLDPCGVYRDGVQHHRVEAPSAEEDPQPQVEVVESTELESAHPPLAVYDNYIEHDLYSFIPLLFCTEQTKEEEVLVEDPYAEEDLQPQAEVESFESESAPPPVVYDRYDEPNHDEIAEVLARVQRGDFVGHSPRRLYHHQQVAYQVFDDGFLRRRQRRLR